MKPPRGLSAGEAELWARVAATVDPLNPPRTGEGDPPQAGGGGSTPAQPLAKARPHPAASPLHPAAARRGPPPRSGEVPLTAQTLDGSWERKLARAGMAPDFTLDLHGYTLDAAHARLTGGLALAIAQQARLVLVIAGKPRPVDAADRGTSRGAIRAKLLDWLAAGPHASRIAAVRPAHPRHGGAGAVYVVLRRPTPLNFG